MIVCFLEPLSAALKLRASSLLGRGISVVKTWNPTPALLRTPSIHLVLSLKIRKSIWILISIVITHASVIQRGADFVEHWKNTQYAIAFQSWNLMFALMHKKRNPHGSLLFYNAVLLFVPQSSSVETIVFDYFVGCKEFITKKVNKLGSTISVSYILNTR